jgi:hypothetical protein
VQATDRIAGDEGAEQGHAHHASGLARGVQRSGGDPRP